MFVLASRRHLKTLHRYLLRQVIATMVMTALVFTFVLLLVNVLREILPLLVNRQVPISLVAEAFFLLIPFVWVFALPMGMLTATLLVFGRFSADQELTAARAGGISLVSLVSPVLLLSLLLCAISAPINLEIAPRCRVAYVDLRERAKKMAIERFQFPEGQHVKIDSKGDGHVDYIVYVEENRKPDLRNIRVWQFANETNLVSVTYAASGRVEADVTNRQVVLRLFDGRLEYIAGGLSIPMQDVAVPINFGGTNRSRTVSASDMTFSQLRAELRRLEQTVAAAAQMTNLPAADAQAKRREVQRQIAKLTEPVRVHLHRQVAFSFACFGFTLIGIPLGIRVHRRETNIGFAIALGLVLLYYSLLILGQAFNTRPEIFPHLLMWVPNFLFQTVGVILLWRANRG